MYQMVALSRKFLLFFMACLCVCQYLSAEAKVIALRGYLGPEKLQEVDKSIHDSVQRKLDALIFEVDSTSGDLKKVMETVRSVYDLKAAHGFKVIVYIENNAVGPSAIFPFLSDELYVSPIVSWGHIPLGTDEAMSTNLLRSKVASLISESNPHSALLKTVAAGMCDPNLLIVYDKGLRVVAEKDANVGEVVSGKGQTLILNRNQLSGLHLIESSMTVEAFREKFEPSETKLLKAPIVEEAVPGLDKSLLEHIKFSETGNNTIGYISIDNRTSAISESTWIYIKGALDYYKKHNPAFIILKLNTPGGEVFAAQKISDELHQIDTQYNIPVIAYIDNWAISAGALIAYSCRYIAAVKDASMGAAEPVIMGEGGEMKSASEKVNSAIRTDFANRARFFDRNSDIAEAMVDKDIILVLRHGKVMKVDNETQIKSKGPDPDRVISPKGKLLTLNAQELLEYGVADMVLPPAKLSPITDAELSTGAWPFSKELLSAQPFLAKIPNAVIDQYKMDWKSRFFAILATPMVSSLLMLGMLMGLYTEFTTPGFGIAGVVGLTCLMLIIISNLSLEIANWLEVVLMLIGVSMILIEIFVFPTVGILAVIGALFFFGGLIAVMLPEIGSVQFEYNTQTFNAAGDEFVRRLAWLSGTMIIAFLLMALMGRFITPKIASFSRLVLTGNEQDASKGYIAGEEPKDLPQSGVFGEVFSTLRPAGKVLIGDRIYDAVTDGSYIEKGERIVVDKLDGSVIVVNRVNPQEGKV